MLFRLIVRSFRLLLFSMLLLRKRTDNFWFCPDCAKPALNATFFDKDIDERSQSYLATVEPRLQNLENSNKLVLEKIKNSISTPAFNDFAEKNNTRLDAFEEELYEIKDLES